MTDKRIFLLAEWNNLLMLNYAVAPSLLKRFVPSGTALDAFNGVTYVSLIGFEFNHTRMFGFPVPFHQAFEEVNLRFYVRRRSRRGVVFIREFVPKRAVASIARLVFNENYSCLPMSHRIETSAADGIVRAEYSWGTGADRCVMRGETEGASFLPPEGSLSQFITEHYWGYAAQPDGGCLEYEVQHPRWTVRNAQQASLSGNVALFYGEEFAECLNRKPEFAFVADGSAITVFKGERIDR